MTIEEKDLQSWVDETAENLEVPGVSVGVYHAGQEHYAFHGITSIENPLPVDAATLFQFGSTGKTFTATAVMRLVEQGVLDLGERVRTYVPELRLKDEGVAREVTLLHLLNHTAGWQGDREINTGDGDDALAKYIEKMEEFDQETPLGATVTYNNASLSLAGRVIEKVTDKTFEQAIKELIFEPLGLEHTYFFNNEIMTRRFAVGHRQDTKGKIKVARPWALTRGGNPAGGASANAGDQILWARFHLGDGRAADGTRVLSKELLKRMQEPTVESPGSAIGDAVGISWLLRDVDGVRLAFHGGTTNGQLSAFLLVPERDFGIASMTNCSPNGEQFNEELVRWALESYAGVVDRDPEPISLDAAQLAPYAGKYETVAMFADFTVEGGGLVINVEIKPEALEELRESGEEEPPDLPPFPVGMLPGEGDRYIVTGGPYKGMKGYFVRDDAGKVEAVHLGGRLATRIKAPAPVS
jgi:CubicO group peptidase (beta-lactamase class C family)